MTWVYKADETVFIKEEKTNVQTNQKIITVTDEVSLRTTTSENKPSFDLDISNSLILKGKHKDKDKECIFFYTHNHSTDKTDETDETDESKITSIKEVISIILEDFTQNPTILSVLLNLDKKSLIEVCVDKFYKAYLKNNAFDEINPTIRMITIKEGDDDSVSLRVIIDIDELTKKDLVEVIKASKAEHLFTIDTTFSITPARKDKAKIRCTKHFIIGHDEVIIDKYIPKITHGLTIAQKKDDITLYQKPSSSTQSPSTRNSIVNSIKDNPLKTVALLLVAGIALAPPIGLFALVVAIPIITVLKIFEMDKENPLPPFHYQTPSISDILLSRDKEIYSIEELAERKRNKNKSDALAEQTESKPTSNNDQNSQKSFSFTKGIFSAVRSLFKNKSVSTKNSLPIKVNSIILDLINFAESKTTIDFLKTITRLSPYLKNDGSEKDMNLAKYLSHLSMRQLKKLKTFFDSQAIVDTEFTLQGIIDTKTAASTDKKIDAAESLLEDIRNIKQAVITLLDNATDRKKLSVGSLIFKKSSDVQAVKDYITDLSKMQPTSATLTPQ